MGVIRSTIVAALVALGGAGAVVGAGGGQDHDEGLITREWVWSTEGTITTFTATGPAEQVNAFEPHLSVHDCKGCELASSIQPSLEGKSLMIEAASGLGAKP